MAKHVFKKVVEAHIHSECSDGFDHARIVVGKELAATILKFQKALKELGANYIHVYDYTPERLNTNYLGKKEKLVKSRTSVDCVQLVVSNDSFWWEGLLKHSDINWETDAIQIEDLEVMTIPPSRLPLYVTREWKRQETKDLYMKRLITESKVAA
jgi:hypothetical protein